MIFQETRNCRCHGCEFQVFTSLVLLAPLPMPMVLRACISKSIVSIGKDIFCLDILQRIIFDVSVSFPWKMNR